MRIRLVSMIVLASLAALSEPVAGAASTYQALHVSFWCVGPLTTTTVHIANASSSPVTVLPTLYLSGQYEQPLAQALVPPLDSIQVTIDQAMINELLPASSNANSSLLGGVCSTWGSLTLRFETSAFPASLQQPALSAWAVSLSKEHSFSINTIAAWRSSAEQELSSIWWLPEGGTNALFALQNPTEQEIVVNPSMVAAGARVDGPILAVPPNGRSLLLSLEDLFGAPVANIGAIVFAAERPGLIGRSILTHAGLGFSVPLKLGPRSTEKRRFSPAALFGSPPPDLGFPAEATFFPTVLATNLGEETLTISITLAGDGGYRWSAGEVAVAPKTGQLLDMRDLCDQRFCPPELNGLTQVEVEIVGNSESAVVEVITTDQTKSYSFYDPLMGPSAGLTVGTGISYDIGGGSSSHIVFSNTTDQWTEGGYLLILPRSFTSSSPPYVRALPTLPPFGADAVDIRRLAVEQVPDPSGRTLPLPSVSTSGFVYMSVPPGITVSNPTFDAAAGTCYSCPVFQECSLGSNQELGWQSASMAFALCMEQIFIPPILLAGGIYEALLVAEDTFDCLFFICRAIGVHPQCEIGQQTIIRPKEVFGFACPTRISGLAISIHVPGFAVACYAVTAIPDSQACQPM